MSDILAYVDLFKDDLDAFEALEFDAWVESLPSYDWFKKLPADLQKGALAAQPEMLRSAKAPLDMFIGAMNKATAIPPTEPEDPRYKDRLYELYMHLEQAKQACERLIGREFPGAAEQREMVSRAMTLVKLEILKAEQDALRAYEESKRAQDAASQGLQQFPIHWSPPPAPPKTPPSRNNELRRMAKGDKSWKR